MAWITDGLSKTVLIAEDVHRGSFIHNGYNDFIRTEIRRCFTEDRSCHTGVFHVHGKGNNTTFCDGSLRFLTADVDREVFRSMLTRAGGESDLRNWTSR